jgi:hypothetical protein
MFQASFCCHFLSITQFTLIKLSLSFFFIANIVIIAKIDHLRL